MSSRFRSLVSLAVAALAVPLALVGPATPASAAVPAGFTDVLVASSLGQSTAFAELPDDRIAVATQDGELWLLNADGTKPATPALDVNPCTNSEQGLLGVAVDPQFGSNGYLYVYYTRNAGSCQNRVSRFTVAGSTIAPASELVLIDNISSSAGNHNGGDVQIGKDGLLYVSVGDNASSGNGQNLNTRHGKILRVGLDGSIPASNPYATDVAAVRCQTSEPGNAKCREIYAYGFRNPFRIAPDVNDAGTRIFVNDVGDVTWEEISELVSNGNFGWDTREGFCARGSTTNCSPQPPGLVPPVHAYGRGDNCRSITGGAFSPAGAFPGRYNGAYFFGDFICGKIFALLPNGSGGWTSETFVDSAASVVHLRTMRRAGVWGVYYLTRSGELHRITSDVAPGQTGASVFHPLSPVRALDTRNGTGYSGRKPAAGDTVSAKMTGSVTGVPNDAVAVALNVTATDATAAGFVTAWPTGEIRPTTSVLNLIGAADTSANAVIARLGSGGQVNLFTQSGAHLVADVTGYWTETARAQAGRYVPAPNPARLLDTRSANGVTTTSIVPAGGTVEVQVTGRGGVPASGVSAVALAVTIANSATSGFVTVFPTGTTRPLASTINPVGANDIRSNLVMLPVGTGGKVSLYTLQATHLVVDVAGWFTDSTAPEATSGLLVATSPQRLIDTRNNNPFGRLNGGDTGIPDYSTVVPAGTVAIVTNLTVDGTQSGGFLTAWPDGEGRPTASNVNWNGPRQTRAALALSRLSGQGKVDYFPNVATDLVVDLSGYFVGEPAAT